MMARHVYVYYRVPHAEASRWHGAARALQQALAGRCAATALQRRPERVDGEWTWMEIYHDVAEDFDTRLQAEVQRLGLDALARHTEVFVDLDAPR